jgi:hypothetical protein
MRIRIRICLFYFDAISDPDPAFHSDAAPDSDPASQTMRLDPLPSIFVFHNLYTLKYAVSWHGEFVN